MPSTTWAMALSILSLSFPAYEMRLATGHCDNYWVHIRFLASSVYSLSFNVLKLGDLLLKVPGSNQHLVQGLFTPDHTYLFESLEPGTHAYFIWAYVTVWVSKGKTTSSSLGQQAPSYLHSAFFIFWGSDNKMSGAKSKSNRLFVDRHYKPHTKSVIYPAI